MLQASAHDVEKQVEAALQKLSSSLPQLPQSSEDLASRVKETGSGVHDLLAGGSSDLTTVLRDFWTQLEASLGGNEGNFLSAFLGFVTSIAKVTYITASA